MWCALAGVLLGLGYATYVGMARFKKSAARREAARVPPDFGMLHPATNPATLASGKVLYRKNCMPCHGPEGGGLIGPNLCDDYFIHGFTFTNTYAVIWEGVPGRNMIAWRVVLSADELYAVASYTWALKGSLPPAPKAPEGLPHP